MKLEFEKIDVEASENFKTKNFGIGDMRTILNMLRSKIYSNPINTICQEVLSNCRDAHRETGRDDVPVTVRMPNSLDDMIHFEDAGPGISPDRMENVFILYGNSTKRGDNVQTGGFGLGAKTPFSYTDSFNIITTTDDEDGKRRKREYIAYIDDSQLGAVSLIKTREVEEPTGTVISMAVKPQDQKYFKDGVKRACSHWKVRPSIERDTIEWIKTESSFDGTGWYLPKRERTRYGYYRDNNPVGPLAIIDGIPYKIVKSDKFCFTTDHNKLLDAGVRFHFEIGELRMTASREGLDYQDDVCERIKVRIEAAVAELRIEVDKTIAGATSLREAVAKWNTVKHSAGGLLVAPKWNNLELLDKVSFDWSHSNDGNRVFIYTQDIDGVITCSRKSRYNTHSVIIQDDMILAEHDEPTERPHLQKVRTLFIQNPNASQVAAVKFKTQKGRDHFEDNINWSHLSPEKLSTVAKTRPPKNALGVRGTVVHFKQLVARNHKRSSWKVYEWKSANVTVKDGGVFVILYGNEVFTSHQNKDDKKPMYKNKVYRLTSLLGEDVYGVVSRTAKKLGSNWTELETKVKERIAEHEADKDVKNYLSLGHEYSMKEWIHNFWKEILDIEANIVDKSKTFYKYVETSKLSNAGKAKVENLHALQEKLRLPTTTVKSKKLKDLHEKCKEEYPLVLALSDGYNRRDITKVDVVEELINYINLKDAAVPKDGTNAQQQTV